MAEAMVPVIVAIEALPAATAAALVEALGAREVERTEPPAPVDVSSGQSSGAFKTISVPSRVHFEGKGYTRETHPKFFDVVDWLNANTGRAMIGVRKIARETDASKSWVSVARRWWIAKQ